MSARILVAEDERNYRDVLDMMLAGEGHTLVFAEDGQAGWEQFEADPPDLVITDLNMPRLSGLELLGRIQASGRPVPVVVVTAYGSVQSAVEAMRLGAIDFLEKPFDEQRLKLTLDKGLRVAALTAENHRLREQLLERWDFSDILGQSPVLVDALKTAGKVARSDATVLVRGESGTGKELVARAIHYNSPRKGGPFIAVNCAAIPESLLEAELFGAKAGAYTGATKARRGRVEQAQRGTLFLDEIGDMPLALQSKLLRLVQEKTYAPLGAEADVAADVRFVFATHRDLHKAAQEGSFREDLYYRVSVVPIELPPLRARGHDVLLLAEQFAARSAQAMSRPTPTITAAAREALLAHPFVGNVRELANVIERAVILAEDDVLDVEDLALAPSIPRPPSLKGMKTPAGVVEAAVVGDDDDDGPVVVLPDKGVILEEVERSLVEQALERTGGNKSQAARLLGLTRATLRYRIEKHGLG
jgi:DNA-binding NtrC family response regulator